MPPKPGRRPDPSLEPLHRRSYRAAKRLLWRSQRPWIARRLRREVTEEVDGVRLAIRSGVHNPVVFRAGLFLARTVARLEGDSGTHVLDMGTGSGISAIFAARAGFRVWAVDINPAAVHCAEENARCNGMSDRITVLEGDLFDPVADRRFDLVLFNPPFFTGPPRDITHMAWRSTDTLQRFAAQLPRRLTPHGYALLVFSSDGDEATLLRAFEQAECRVEVLDWKDLGNEVLTIYSISAAGRDS